jgi:hypothetical protein
MERVGLGLVMLEWPFLAPFFNGTRNRTIFEMNDAHKSAGAAGN